MAVFSDEAEVYEYLGGIFEIGTKKDGLADKLAGSGLVLRVRYTDPAAVITVDLPGKSVQTGADCALNPTVELHMTADVGNLFWLGKLNLVTALGKGQVRAKGPVAKMIKLIPAAKQLFPEYRKLLVERGRNDLLNA